MIDTVVLFLRHNLRKRLDVETYMCVLSSFVSSFPCLSDFHDAVHSVALRLLQRIMQQLKAEKVRLGTFLPLLSILKLLS